MTSIYAVLRKSVSFLFLFASDCSDEKTFSCKGIQGKKVFSQNDEDGAIEDVFKHIGTTNKVRFDQEIWQNGRKGDFNGKKRDWTQISIYVHLSK